MNRWNIRTVWHNKSALLLKSWD